MDDALRVREFWFGKSLTGPLPGEGNLASVAQILTRRASVWFESNPQARGQGDEMIRSQFQALVERAGRGELSAWADSPRRRLSLPGAAAGSCLVFIIALGSIPSCLAEIAAARTWACWINLAG